MLSLPEDLAELVCGRLGLEGREGLVARATSTATRAACDATGCAQLADALDRLLGLGDPAQAAGWMAADVSPWPRVGWREALSLVDRARRGDFTSSPTEGSMARYLDTLAAGRRPGFDPDRSAVIWDCDPYNADCRAMPRVVVVSNGLVNRYWAPTVWLAMLRANKDDPATLGLYENQPGRYSFLLPTNEHRTYGPETAARIARVARAARAARSGSSAGATIVIEAALEDLSPYARSMVTSTVVVDSAPVSSVLHCTQTEPRSGRSRRLTIESNHGGVITFAPAGDTEPPPPHPWAD